AVVGDRHLRSVMLRGSVEVEPILRGGVAAREHLLLGDEAERPAAERVDRLARDRVGDDIERGVAARHEKEQPEANLHLPIRPHQRFPRAKRPIRNANGVSTTVPIDICWLKKYVMASNSTPL